MDRKSWQADAPLDRTKCTNFLDKHQRSNENSFLMLAIDVVIIIIIKTLAAVTSSDENRARDEFAPRFLCSMLQYMLSATYSRGVKYSQAHIYM